MIKKIVFASVLWVSVGASFLEAQQEQDGFFTGFGIGFGGGGAMIEIKMPDKTTKAKTAQNFINYDLKIGYKSFFNEWFGLRGYLSFGYSNAKNMVAPNNGSIAPVLVEQDFSVNIVDYYANLDLLFEVYATEAYRVGLLGGIGIGGLDVYYRDQFLGNQNTSGFQMNLKIGARLNIQQHGVEFVARVPFFGPSLSLKVATNANMKMDFRQNYLLSMSYVYNFGVE